MLFKNKLLSNVKFFNILIMDNDKLNISKTKTFLNNNSNIRVFQALDIKDSLMVVIKNKIDLSLDFDK